MWLHPLLPLPFKFRLWVVILVGRASSNAPSLGLLVAYFFHGHAARSLPIHHLHYTRMGVVAGR